MSTFMPSQEHKDRILTILKDNPHGVNTRDTQDYSNIYANIQFGETMAELKAAGLVYEVNHSTSGEHITYIHADNVTAMHKTKGSAGADTWAIEDVTIAPGETVLVNSAFIPPPWLARQGMYAFLAMARSSYWGDYKLLLTNGTGLIDKDYPKNVKFSYFNMGTEPVNISKGDIVGQLVLISVVQHSPVSDVERVDGFGSTTIKGDGDEVKGVNASKATIEVKKGKATEPKSPPPPPIPKVVK